MAVVIEDLQWGYTKDVKGIGVKKRKKISEDPRVFSSREE